MADAEASNELALKLAPSERERINGGRDRPPRPDEEEEEAEEAEEAESGDRGSSTGVLASSWV